MYTNFSLKCWEEIAKVAEAHDCASIMTLDPETTIEDILEDFTFIKEGEDEDLMVEWALVYDRVFQQEVLVIK